MGITFEDAAKISEMINKDVAEAISEDLVKMAEQRDAWLANPGPWKKYLP